MTHRFGGVILAGGQARRLGGISKSSLRIGERSFLDISVARFEEHIQDVAVAFRSERQSSVASNRAVIYDYVVNGKEIGPAGGVLAALSWARIQDLFGVITIPVDTPCLPDDFIERLLQTAETRGACHAKSWRGPEWAHSVWMCKDENTLKAFVEKSGGASLKQLHHICQSAAVPFPRQRDADFVNINTRADVDILGATLPTMKNGIQFSE